MRDYYSSLCRKMPDVSIFMDKPEDKTYELYLKDNYGLSSQKVNFLALILTLCITMVGLIFCVDSLFLVFLFLISMIFVYNKLRMKYKEKFSKQKEELTASIPILKTLLSIYEISNPDDYDRCLVLISILSKIYKNESNRFLKMAQRVQCGANIETVLFNSVENYEEFEKFIRSYVRQGIDYNFDHNASLKDKYREFTESLETRFSFLFFISVFLPLSINLAVIMGFLSIQMLVFVVPVFTMILKSVSSNFVVQSTTLFGVRTNKNDTAQKEYAGVIDFILDFIHHLKYNSHERALFYAVKSSKFMESHIANTNIINKQRWLTTADFISVLIASLASHEAKVLLHMINILIAEDTYSGADQIDNLILTLQQHQNLEKERETIYKSQKFKQILLLMLVPLINGILVSIIPLMRDLLLGIDLNAIDFLGNLRLDSSELGMNEILLLFVIQISILVTNFYYQTLWFDSKTRITVFLYMIFVFILTVLVSYLYVINRPMISL